MVYKPAHAQSRIRDMAFRRRVVRRRKPFIRRRRMIRKRHSTFKRQGRKRFSDVYHTHAAQTGNIIMDTDNTKDFHFRISVNLDGFFPGFQQVFRQGRVNKIIFKFIPSTDQVVLTNAAATIGTAHGHQIHTAIDHAGILDFNQDDITRYSTYKRQRWTRPFTRKFTPSLIMDVAGINSESPTPTSWSPIYKKWLPLNASGTSLTHGQMLMLIVNSTDIAGKLAGSFETIVFASFKEKF